MTAASMVVVAPSASYGAQTVCRTFARADTRMVLGAHTSRPASTAVPHAAAALPYAVFALRSAPVYSPRDRVSSSACARDRVS